MSGNLLEKVRTGPITQSIDAVKALLTWKGHPVSPLPADVSMDNGRLVLVLSNKRDSYYTVTATKCSCPAANYHHGPCKHQRRYFPGPQKSPAELEAESDALLAAHNTGGKRLARPPEDSIRPSTGAFKPFDEMPREEKARAAPLYVDCGHDTTEAEVAYFERKEAMEA